MIEAVCVGSRTKKHLQSTSGVASASNNVLIGKPFCGLCADYPHSRQDRNVVILVEDRSINLSLVIAAAANGLWTVEHPTFSAFSRSK